MERPSILLLKQPSALEGILLREKMNPNILMLLWLFGKYSREDFFNDLDWCDAMCFVKP